MSEWFHTKVKFLRQMGNGLIKQVTEQYLVDAMSFTESEARVLKEVGEGMRELQMMAVSRSPIKEVVFYGDTDLWFKVKVQYSLMDEETEKDKKITTYLLVNANDLKESYERTEEHLKEMLVPFRITKAEESPIIDIFQYQKGLRAGLRKVSSTEITGDGSGEALPPFENRSRIGFQVPSKDEALQDAHEEEEECAFEDSAVESNINPIFAPILESIKGKIPSHVAKQMIDHSTQVAADGSRFAGGVMESMIADYNSKIDPTDGQAVDFQIPGIVDYLDSIGLNLTVPQLNRVVEQSEQIADFNEFCSWMVATHSIPADYCLKVWDILHESEAQGVE